MSGFRWNRAFCIFIASGCLLVAAPARSQGKGDPNKYSTTPGNPQCRFFDGFADNGDGTVTDPRNGLVWKRCTEGLSWIGGQCVGKPSTVNWYLAMKSAKNSQFLGKNDWRLPTYDELIMVTGENINRANSELCHNNSNGAYAVSSNISSNMSREPRYWSTTSLPTKSDRVLGVNIVVGHLSWDFINSVGTYGFRRDDSDQVAALLVRDGRNIGNSEFNMEYAKVAQYQRGQGAADNEERRKESQRKSDAAQACMRHYIGKVVTLKGGYGLTFEGEVKGIGNTMMTVRYNFLGEWKSAEFACVDYP